MVNLEDEFAFIARWLSSFPPPSARVPIGPGDDAAALRPAPGKVLVATTDALVDGVHFHSDRWPPAAVGHKALAVNLSDLASMGAKPRFALLAIGLAPGLSPAWLDKLAKGMSSACQLAGVELVGGNMSRARDLSLTITLLGDAEESRLLKRSGARPGDLVWVSGTLGDSALGLASMLGRAEPPKRLSRLEARHCRPEARVGLGLSLSRLGAATAAIDVSDGFIADLGHLLASGKVGARIDLSAIPLSPAYRRASAQLSDPLRPALTGGEDYELLFTSRPTKTRLVEKAGRSSGVSVRAIGTITAARDLVLIEADGRRRETDVGGWRHW